MGKHQAAGKPPHPPKVVVVDPAGGDGPPTEAYTALDAPDDHEARPTEGYRVPTPIADDVRSAGRRVKLGPVTRAFVKSQRMRRVWRVLETIVFACLAVPITLTAGYLSVVAYLHRNDLTETELREASPLLALCAAALLMVVLLLFVLWREGRIR